MAIPVIVAPNPYQLDTTVQLNGTFTEADGVTLVDPTTVTIAVQDPTGVITEYTVVTTPAVVRVSTGIYYLQIEPTISGVWIYKWQGAGVLNVTSPDTYFTVQPSVLIAG